MNNKKKHIESARQIIISLGLPRAQHNERSALFAESKIGLVYVTAFPNRTFMSRHLSEIAWETEVWVADAPSHLIHFDGLRFLGPYN